MSPGRLLPCWPAPLPLVLGLVVLSLPGTASASFHNWEIREVYSNADGTIQYVELATPDTLSGSGQNFLDGHIFRSQTGATTFNTYTLTHDLDGETRNRTFLLATPGFEAATGIVPDVELPCAPFFNQAAATITLNFVDADSVTFNSSALPFGTPANALYIPVSGSPTTTSAATPQRFNATAGAMTAACLADDTCDPCGDTDFCQDGCLPVDDAVCTGLFERCPDGGCNEDTNTCPCDDGPTDCSDGNPCTDDVCIEGECSNPNNDQSCNDPDFCTTGDTCGGGSCQPGAGSPCSAGLVCNEATNHCDCNGAEDCTDGVFCNGAEACTSGNCGAGTAACTGDEICDEPNDQCDECDDLHPCNDTNLCTDDACIGSGVCDFENNTDSCNDDLFCNGTDTCGDGACGHTGSPCGAENCNEGSNTCGDCVGVADCDDSNPCTNDACTAGDCVYTDVADDTACTDDGAFCTGLETCQSGACVSDGDPCDPSSETCDEEGNDCSSTCGNGAIDSGEECDDGNSEALDGCDGDCLEEPGFSCLEDPGPESVCISDCGDGVLADGAEACDDGDEADEEGEDGCDGACEIEDGWGCAADDQGVDVCDPIFGDGLLVGDEVCDDGNDTDGDGCFEGAVEAGFACDDAEPSNCASDQADEPADEPGDQASVEPIGDVGESDASGDAAEPGADTGSASAEDEGCCSTAAGTRGPDPAALLAIIGLVVLNRQRRPGW